MALITSLKPTIRSTRNFASRRPSSKGNPIWIRMETSNWNNVGDFPKSLKEEKICHPYLATPFTLSRRNYTTYYPCDHLQSGGWISLGLLCKRPSKIPTIWHWLLHLMDQSGVFGYDHYSIGAKVCVKKHRMLSSRIMEGIL